MKVTIYLNTTSETRPGCWDCQHCGATGHGEPGGQCPRCTGKTRPFTSLVIWTRPSREKVQPGDELQEVATYDVDTPTAAAAAEDAFAIGNGVRPESDDYYSHAVRSMSSGDVAVVDTPDGPAAYACQSYGWTSVDFRTFNVTANA